MNNSVENNEQISAASPEEGWTAKDAVLAVVAFAVIIAVAAGAYFFWQARKTEPVEAGSTAPDFTLPLLSGGEASLSDYRGKVVMLNIWATTCTSCREEFPSMERLYQNMKAKGLPFEMLAASTDKKGAEQINPFITDIKVSDETGRLLPVKVTFPILLDSEEKVHDLYGVNRLPETYIIDKNGVVRDHILGPVNWASTSTYENQLIQHLLQTQ